MEQVTFKREEILLSIGDVAKLLNIPTHTLRFWENEFAQFLHPVRTVGKQRRYTDEDIKTIEKIAHMLRIDKYSIAGAKRALYEQFHPEIKPKSILIPEDIANEIANFIKDKLIQRVSQPSGDLVAAG